MAVPCLGQSPPQGWGAGTAPHPTPGKREGWALCPQTSRSCSSHPPLRSMCQARGEQGLDDSTAGVTLSPGGRERRVCPGPSPGGSRATNEGSGLALTLGGSPVVATDPRTQPAQGRQCPQERHAGGQVAEGDGSEEQLGSLPPAQGPAPDLLWSQALPVGSLRGRFLRCLWEVRPPPPLPSQEQPGAAV